MLRRYTCMVRLIEYCRAETRGIGYCAGYMGLDDWITVNSISGW